MSPRFGGGVIDSVRVRVHKKIPPTACRLRAVTWCTLPCRSKARPDVISTHAPFPVGTIHRSHRTRHGPTQCAADTGDHRSLGTLGLERPHHTSQPRGTMKTRSQGVTCLRGITLAIAVNLIPAATLWADSPKVAAPPPSSMAAVQSVYGHLPLSFEANQGQVDPRVQFLSRRHGHTLFLTPSEAVLTLR